jgi:transcriptional regulator with XRE-family HTH domain
MATNQPVGDQLREWRRRRRLSQLDLALDADISARHLSFLETGRARPSRGMLLRLADRLGLPLRERNSLLLAAGFAPVYPQHSLADPAMDAARGAIDLLLAGHEPYPALAVDRHWHLIAANRSVALLLEGADPHLLSPPINVLRLSLHPNGLASRIVNLAEWREHVLHRLHHQIAATADPVLSELAAELMAYPAPAAAPVSARACDPGGVLVPLRLATRFGELSFIGTTTVFGTPLDVTLAEVALETFLPADATTAAILREMTGS